jgi:hypothetical protein
MSTWLINNQSPEYWGLTLVSWQMNGGRASSVQLSRNIDFDAVESFEYGDTVTIKRDGSAWFQGKVRAIPKSGSASTEGQDYLVEDAWAELERLTYQEPWGTKQAPDAANPTGEYYVYTPTVILGMDSSGAKLNVGQQIAEVLTFAASQGVALQVGTMPSGMTLWPSEVVGQSCASIIRDCLKYYPDWIPWIDHTTMVSGTIVPTFNVTPRASAASVTLAVTQCEDLSVTRKQDRVPDGVRICYVTANITDDGSGDPAVFRTLVIDQYPTVSLAALKAPAGPGILVTTLELAGSQMQIQKQQIQTRLLPEEGASTAAKKAYLKLKFPVLKDIADSKIDIDDWTTSVIPSEDDEADAIDGKIPRVPGEDRGDLPRELVKGTVTEWMQKKVGRVLVEMTVVADSSASEEEKKKIESLPPHFSVTATNATTKIYRGVSSYTAGDARPAGIAQAYYQTLINGCDFEGQIVLKGEELPGTNFHGKTLNLSGANSRTGWASMGAPIHSVTQDLRTGSTVISFGPNPDYSVQDFLEFLKLLNKRPYNEYTIEERDGNEFGSNAGRSARGDSVGPYDVPETITGGGSGGGGETFSHPFKITTSKVDGVAKYRVSKGSIIYGTNGAAFTIPGTTFDTDQTATAGYVVLSVSVAAGPELDTGSASWALSIVTSAPQEVTMDSATPPAQNSLKLLLGKITVDTTTGVATAWQAWTSSARVVHAILNGVEVLVLEAAPTHPTII